MKLISIRLEEHQDKRLTAMSSKSGATKSAIIRDILNKYFNTNQIMATTPSPEQPLRTGDPFDKTRRNYHRNELTRNSRTP